MIGMIAYGFMASFFSLPNIFAYLFLGGIMFGGLASGIIISRRYIKRKKSVVLVILSFILFPISLTIIYLVGLYTLIPEYISNVIALIRLKKSVEPKSVGEGYLRSKRKIGYAFAGLLSILYAVYFINTSIVETNINNDIYKNTGYKIGAPEHVIIKNYYYNGANTNYSKDNDFNYVIKNDTLFILANNNGICHSDIIFAQPNGNYPDKTNYLKSTNFYSNFLRKEIDMLFTEIRIANHGNKHAFMLIVDIRSEQEKVGQMIQTRHMNKQTADIFLDKTHADPESIQLFGGKGTLLETIRIAKGKYIAFYDSFNDDEKDYKVIVSYDGNEYTLLTFYDIVNCDVYRKDSINDE